MTKWVTPPAAAADYLELAIRVPNHPTGRAVLRGLLLSVMDPENWMDIDGLTPEEAAAEWIQATDDVWALRDCEV